MEGTFSVFLNGQTVGKVQVSREGLYYRFSARCHLREKEMCRLEANGINLGIPAPEGAAFRLETKKPAKLFSGKWDFQIIPNRPAIEGKFVPIKPEEPFSYLSRLKESYLVRKGDLVGIILKE